ncbi:hypothetical protein OUZ56_002676 [Daphnia magna]|uniref:Uncharacterized protein n=1 Tax=Daphnia magna TaxID=35525 RepID=A0ABR0A6G2_9CRUS|nr:hypothetical protein OUZ56_002676 [Daphnia magna]
MRNDGISFLLATATLDLEKRCTEPAIVELNFQTEKHNFNKLRSYIIDTHGSRFVITLTNPKTNNAASSGHCTQFR